MSRKWSGCHSARAGGEGDSCRRKEPLGQAVADLCSDLGSPLLEALICTIFKKLKIYVLNILIY